MVCTIYTTTQIKTEILDEMDSYTYLGVGDDNTTPSLSDTTLGNEVDRNLNTDNIKDVNTGKYLFGTTFTLTEANGYTLREFGLFDAATGGNMTVRNLITPEVDKTSDVEFIQNLQVTIKLTNT